MNKKLWEPSKILKKKSNLFKFEKFISSKFNKKFNTNYEKFHIILNRVLLNNEYIIKYIDIITL